MGEQPAVVIKSVRSEEIVRPTRQIDNGSYILVGVGRSSCDQIWWDEKRQGKVIVEGSRRDKYPFRVIISDFDGTLVDTEGDDKFFVVRFIEFLRNAGISGSDDQLRALRNKSYRWEGTFARSVEMMIQRISWNHSLSREPFDGTEREALKRIYSHQNLVRWSKESGKHYDELIAHRHEIIAGKIEALGMELLKRNPERVLQLAPLKVGVLDFIRKLPRDLIFAIASASRRETTIRPIFEAYAAIGNSYLRDRVGNNIVGEEDVFGQVKPNDFYYQQAAASLGYILYKEGRIPPCGVETQDILIIGDRIAKTDIFDTPASRVMYHLVVNAGVDTADLGPLTGIVKDFATLMETVNTPFPQMQNSTLRRLALTLARK